VAEAEDHENKGKTPTLLLLHVGVPIGFGMLAPSGSLSDEDTQDTFLQANADTFKAWGDSILNLTNSHDGKSYRVHRLTPAHFAACIPRRANDKASWITSLTSNICTVVEAMKVDDIEYTDQPYDLAQQNAPLSQTQGFVQMNSAAKE
jgi:hypothetical protein